MKTEKQIQAMVDSLQEHKKSLLQLMLVTDNEKLNTDYEKILSSIKALEWVLKP